MPIQLLFSFPASVLFIDLDLFALKRKLLKKTFSMEFENKTRIDRSVRKTNAISLGITETRRKENKIENIDVFKNYHTDNGKKNAWYLLL